MRISTVNDNITLFEVGFELSNEVVYGLTGLYEEDDLPGTLELLAQLLDGEGADDLRPCWVN